MYLWKWIKYAMDSWVTLAADKQNQGETGMYFTDR